MSATREVAEAVVKIDIDAPPEVVWDALTTDEGLAAWIGDGSTIGSRPGDELHVHDIVTGRYKRGVLDEVTPHRRLGYTWWPDAAPEEATRVAISLEPCPSGTRVTVIESQPAAARIWGAAEMSGDWLWRSALLQVGVSSLRVASTAIFC